MPRRDWRLRAEDILEAIARIDTYTRGLTFEEFSEDPKTIDAVLRNLEIIGEAPRHLEPGTTDAVPDVPWSDVRDMRSILVHEYFGVDVTIV